MILFLNNKLSIPVMTMKKHIDGDEVDNNCKDDVISNAGATSLENGNIQSQVVEEDVG